MFDANLLAAQQSQRYTISQISESQYRSSVTLRDDVVALAVRELFFSRFLETCTNWLAVIVLDIIRTSIIISNKQTAQVSEQTSLGSLAI